MKMVNFQINKLLWPMKAHYFLFNSGTAPVTPFLSVYAAKELGFSSVIVGIIFTILPISGMLAKPLMGAIADKFKCQKKIFLASIIVTALAFISILYVPALEEENVVRFRCDKSEAVLDTCSKTYSKNEEDAIVKTIAQAPNSTAYCKLSCNMDQNMRKTVENYWHISDENTNSPLKFTAHIPTDLTDFLNCVMFRIKNVTLIDQRTIVPICPESLISSECTAECTSNFVLGLLPKRAVGDLNVYEYYQFWIFLALMIIAWIGQAVVVSVSDAVCFELLGNDPNKYGNQRSFGSLGWGIFSIIAGLILDSSGNDTHKNYTAAFYLSAGMLALDFIISLRLKSEQRHTSPSIFKDISRLLTDVRILIFMVWCICVGVCTGLIWNFFFWLLEELAQNQEWIKTLEGLAMAIQCLGGELPFFFLSGWILKKIGHVNAMSLILLAIGVRFILYSIIVDPWYVLPIELFNGVTFGLFYACMASYASIVAPPGTETTVQGSVGALFEIGVSIGSFVGGLSFHQYGGSITFRLFGIAALIACLVHCITQFILYRWTKDLVRYTSPPEALDFLADDQQELKLVDS